MRDDFISSLELSPEELVAAQSSSQETVKRRRAKKDEFCQIPFRVVVDIMKTGSPPPRVLGVLAALYEHWFRNCRYNPVKLTSAALRKYGVTRMQKSRALKFLEKSGCVWIDHSSGKNPWVTLKWLELKPPPGF
jgi:hypothetical protein